MTAIIRESGSKHNKRHRRWCWRSTPRAARRALRQKHGKEAAVRLTCLFRPKTRHDAERL